jgi:hypothetical protein
MGNSITTHNYVAIPFKSFFCSRYDSREASTPSHGGEAFRMNSPNNHWFGSSELNLIFEGLLLGQAEGVTQRGSGSCPRELGPN